MYISTNIYIIHVFICIYILERNEYLMLGELYVIWFCSQFIVCFESKFIFVCAYFPDGLKPCTVYIQRKLFPKTFKIKGIRWIHNQKENCHYDHMPFTLKGIRKIFLWVTYSNFHAAWGIGKVPFKVRIAWRSYNAGLL